MSVPDSMQFHRGREARRLGEPRVIRDGRMSSATRANWYAGWDHEDRLRAEKMPEERRAENLQPLLEMVAGRLGIDPERHRLRKQLRKNAAARRAAQQIKRD